MNTTGYLIRFPSLKEHEHLGAPLRQTMLAVNECQELEHNLRELCELTGHHHRYIRSQYLGGTGGVYWCVVCGDWFYI